MENSECLYWCVVTSVYDDGRVSCNIVDTVTAERRPESVYNSSARKDVYIDYFDSQKEAEEYAEEGRRLNPFK